MNAVQCEELSCGGKQRVCRLSNSSASAHHSVQDCVSAGWARKWSQSVSQLVLNSPHLDNARNPFGHSLFGQRQICTCKTRTCALQPCSTFTLVPLRSRSPFDKVKRQVANATDALCHLLMSVICVCSVLYRFWDLQVLPLQSVTHRLPLTQVPFWCQMMPIT